MEIRHECQRCGRVLKNAKAIEVGMGKVCRRKSLERLEDIQGKQSSSEV